MEFIDTKPGFPFSSAVIHSGRTLETVLTGMLPGEKTPVSGGVVAELQEIFRQLDDIPLAGWCRQDGRRLRTALSGARGRRHRRRQRGVPNVFRHAPAEPTGLWS